MADCQLFKALRKFILLSASDLQSVHGFRCYDNTAPNAKCQRVLVLALCLVTQSLRACTC